MAGGMEISIRDDFRKLQRELKGAQRKAVPKAAQAALNKTAVSVRSALVKSLSAETGIKQKDIRAGTTLKKAKMGDLTATIEVRGRALNLFRFKARAVRAGVAASPWRKRRTFRGAFTANGGRTVMIRKGKARLPIRPMFGPSIAREMIRGKEVEKAWRARFGERWPIEMARALNNEFRKMGLL